MIKIKKIFCPTDFSEYSEHARPYVESIAKEFGAEVVLFHAVIPPAFPAYYEILESHEVLLEKFYEQAQTDLDGRAEKFRADGIEAKTLLATGTAFVEIVKAAREEDADIIILATHGLGAIKHVFLGSTAEKVVRKAKCPVLTVRDPNQEDDGDSAD